MKKILSFCLIFCLAFSFCGCKKKNNTKNGAALDAVSVQNKASSESSGSDSVSSQSNCEHDFSPATCTKPKTCKKCGETSGEPLGHKWIPATCKEIKTCSVCNKKEGELGDHTYSKGYCTVCNAKDPDYGLLTSHSWQLFKSTRLITLDFKNRAYSEAIMKVYSQFSDNLKGEIVAGGGESQIYVSGGTEWYPVTGQGFDISYKEEKGVVTISVSEGADYAENGKLIVFKRVGETKLRVTKCELKDKFWKLSVGDVLTADTD